MRVVQIIDSLESGGAERMAVTIANELVNKIPFSGLLATRKEGDLKESIDKEVSYLFLEKSRTFDFNAIWKCRRYLIRNKITHIHSHGSSYFFAVLVKILYPRVKLLWHDHHGNRVYNKKTNIFIKMASFFFDGVFTVNKELEQWAKDKLCCKNVLFLPNFLPSKVTENIKTTLEGIDGKRIVCLANLREPKNHITLLKAFLNSEGIKSEWSLHLVGRDNKDEYSNEIKSFIQLNDLSKIVFIYGSCSDTNNILKQADVGILVSTFEGFPVTLLEYGMANLAVISTNVGYCSSLVENEINGLIVNPRDAMDISNKMDRFTTDSNFRKELSLNFNTFVTENYSSNKILDLILPFYK
jgi:glycosyltransferase involved in cell wall biosynthesis